MGCELTAVLDSAIRVLDADTDLMLRFQAGESACFDELVARYRQPLMGFLYRMVRDHAASEEMLQEAFLRVYLHRARYRPQARFSTWMYQIVHNLARNYVRDHRRDRLHDSIDDTGDAEFGNGETSPIVLADRRPTAEQVLVDTSVVAERQRRIRNAIGALPERQQAAVVMNKYQGMNYAEIGAALKLSESATKSLLFRAYESLRQALKDLL